MASTLNKKKDQALMQVKALTKKSLRSIGILIGVSFIVSIFVPFISFFFVIGIALGSSMSLLNVQILAGAYKDLIFYQRNIVKACLGSFFSLLTMGFSVFLVAKYLSSCLVGFAFGLAAPILFGLLFMGSYKKQPD